MRWVRCMKQRNNLKPFVLLFVITFLSKLLGFLKTSILAAAYGMSVETDIYNLADGLVAQLFYSFTTAVSVIIVPIYLERKQESELEGRRFARSSYLSLWGFGFAMFVIAYAVSPLLSGLMGRTYTVQQQALLTSYMRVLNAGIVLSLVTNALQSLLNAERSYGFASVCGMINSVVIISLVLLLSERIGMWALVVSTPVAYFIQTLFLRLKAAPMLRIPLRECRVDESLKRLYRSAFPVFLSYAAIELDGFVDKYILAGLDAGAVTAVSYSMQLIVFATSLITVPLTTILFTDVSELCAQEDYESVRVRTEQSIAGVILVSLPVMVITICCPDAIVTLVYGYGRFDPAAVSLTATALAVYGFSIVFYILKDAINRVAYALLDTKKILWISVASMLAHITVSLLLAPRWGMRGVQAGTVARVVTMVLLTYWLVLRRRLHCRMRAYLPSACKLAAALGASVGVVLLTRGALASVLGASRLGVLCGLVVCTFAGMAVYFGVLLLLRDKLLFQIIDAVKKRRKKT